VAVISQPRGAVDSGRSEEAAAVREQDEDRDDDQDYQDGRLLVGHGDAP
jgi:hypothetical protein